HIASDLLTVKEKELARVFSWHIERRHVNQCGGRLAGRRGRKDKCEHDLDWHDGSCLVMELLEPRLTLVLNLLQAHLSTSFTPLALARLFLLDVRRPADLDLALHPGGGRAAALVPLQRLVHEVARARRDAHSIMNAHARELRQAVDQVVVAFY